MRLPVVEGDARLGAALRQYGLSEGEAGERRRVEVRERVKGVALDVTAFDGGIEKAGVEVRVVADEDRAVAALVADLPSNDAEQLRQNGFLVLGLAERVIGVDTREVEGCLLDIGALEGDHVELVRFVHGKLPGGVHAYEGGGNLEDGVRGGAESARLHVDDDGQETPEPFADGHGQPDGLSMTCQRRSSPARRGTRRVAPRGREAGTVVATRRSVTVSLLQGIR